tara:strand:- start:4528 stop:5520 length:993 start_codon:yes stop_codon:yes gene_type:complete
MSSFSSSKPSTPVVLGPSDWDTSAVKFLPPRVNDMGGKAINVISRQTNRSLHISTPLMMTWGIADYVNEHGESDGKFSITLNFPNEEYSTDATGEFLKKMKDFENKILDAAVENSEQWWGEKMSREICKHTFFPYIKYRKNKETKKLDLESPPSIRAKVPKYGDKWNVELYDTDSNQMFPCDDPDATPPDFVPKMSNIACVLQCGGIWIGGKGWGLTWKMVQGVVKPRVNNSIYGKCHIQLSNDEKEKMNSAPVVNNDDDDDTPAVDTVVDDSDDEATVAVEETQVVEAEVVAPVKKKVVKKKAATVEEDKPAAVVKKKIVKKKVVAAAS